MEPKRLLVVDDDKRLTDFLQKLFGDRMQVALNGEQALKAIQLEKPALMLLDMRMPGMNGIEVLKIVKASHPDIKVIVISSFDEEYKESAKQLGADAVFAKPLPLRDLTAKIKQLLQEADPPGHLADVEFSDGAVPKARILFVTMGLLDSSGILVALHVIGEGTIDKEDRDYPDAGLYDYEQAHSYKEAVEKLREFRPDFVFIPIHWWDTKRGLLMSRRVSASDLTAEFLRSKQAPKEIFVLSGGYRGLADAEEIEEVFQAGSSKLEEPDLFRSDFEKQAGKINQLLWDKCKKFGLMSKLPTAQSGQD